MPVTIRKATMDDYEPICALFEATDQRHIDALPEIFEEIDGPARPKSFILDFTGSDDAILFVAEEDSEIIGFVNAIIVEESKIPLFKKRKYVLIDTIAVEESQRGKGTGKKLIETIYDWARKNEISEIQLSVWEFNKDAVKFYEKLGYSTASRILYKKI